MLPAPTQRKRGLSQSSSSSDEAADARPKRFKSALSSTILDGEGAREAVQSTSPSSTSSSEFESDESESEDDASVEGSIGGGSTKEGNDDDGDKSDSNASSYIPSRCERQAARAMKTPSESSQSSRSSPESSPNPWARDSSQRESGDLASARPASPARLGKPAIGPVQNRAAEGSIMSRLSQFLPEMVAANKILEADRTAGTLESKQIEMVKEGERHIEMNLGLGVLEHKEDNQGDETDDLKRKDAMQHMMGIEEETPKPSIQEL
ncbi:MAG: hypothetical protein M1814_003035 [Vezdaea aestivalis]|nr:MAG: hypothetical protein M1814_003035 [Vezdaea aestivalis]